MKKFVLMRKKLPGMNGKIMTPTFFELFTVYIKKLLAIHYLLYIVLLQVVISEV